MSKGLNTYPGFPGTAFAVGNSDFGEETFRWDDGFELVFSLRPVCGAEAEVLCGLSLVDRGGCRGAEATSGGGTG